MADSNILEWSAEFRDLIDGFDFTVPGKDASLGKDLVGIAAQAIVDRSIADQGPANGGKWDKNDPLYAAMKKRKHGVDKVGVLTGQMLSLESVKGEPDIGRDEVIMTYGTGTPATRFATYGDVKDDEPTDRQKAEWFAEGGREFYELSESDAEAIYAEVAEALEDYLTGA